MGEIVALKRGGQGPDEAHLSGNAQCVGCGHRWVAVCPVGAVELECPACGLNTGRMRNLCLPCEGEKIWACPCGCDLFVVVETKGYMCSRCGLYQTGF